MTDIIEDPLPTPDELAELEIFAQPDYEEFRVTPIEGNPQLYLGAFGVQSSTLDKRVVRKPVYYHVDTDNLACRRYAVTVETLDVSVDGSLIIEE